METKKTSQKNKIKNKKGQPIKKQLKTKKKIDQKIQKIQKIKNRLLFFWGPIFLYCSLVMLLLNSSHPPPIKTPTTRPPHEAPSPPDPLPGTKKEQKTKTRRPHV